MEKLYNQLIVAYSATYPDKTVKMAQLTLGEIWSTTVIDGYPVKAEFIMPTEKVKNLEKKPSDWNKVHVRES